MERLKARVGCGDINLEGCLPYLLTREGRIDMDEVREDLRRLRESLGKATLSSSVDMIREGRDR